MRLLDQLTSLVAPHDCVNCGQEGSLVCRSCWTQIPLAPHRCYRCSAPSPEGSTCSDCLKSTPIERVISLTQYDMAPKELVWRLKFQNARAAAREMAVHMQKIVQASEKRETYLVPVPTVPSRARRRGYDQAKILARELARQLGMPYLDCLQRRSGVRQVGSSRTQRLHQLAGAFYAKKELSDLSHCRIILIDDVITTGATIEAAAVTLARKGVGSIEAVTFAQA